MINLPPLFEAPKRFLLRFAWALRLVWKSGRGWFSANIAIIFIQGLLPLLSLYLLKLTVDTISASIRSGNREIIKTALLYILLLAATNLFTVITGAFSKLIAEIQSQIVGDRVYGILHTQSTALDLSYYETPEYHDLYHRAQREAPFRPTSIVSNLIGLFQSGISLIAVAGLLVACHWIIAAALFLSVLPGVLLRAKYADTLYQWQVNVSETERKAHYYNWILTGDLHAKELRLFGFGDLFRRRFSDLRTVLRKEKIGIAVRRTAAEAAYQFAVTLALFGALAYILFRVGAGSLTVGDFVMYYQALFRCQGYLREVLSGMAGLYENGLFLSDFAAFMELRPKVCSPENPKPPPSPIKEGIHLEGVGFSYPGADTPVLREIDLRIGPNEHIALVGENGEGKTTLIKLLCRLYDPVQGRIEIDGTDLKDLDIEAYRGGISVIFQDFVKYRLTARENIGLGKTAAPDAPERMERAARLSGADRLIRKLPKGYDTVLSRWFKGGVELSEGQWQKIALARALMRDAQIVILDEPASALDAKAEYALFQKFHEITAGKTALFISHRLSTARLADRIIVLKDGRIAESGPHGELMKAGGHYARLFELQSRPYR